MSGRGERSRAAPRRSWGALELVLPGPLGDELLAAVGQGCLGARSFPGAPDGERWIAYFASARAAAAGARRVRALVRRHGLDPRSCGLACRAIADERWAERYQATLRPFEVGRRFTVDPTGEGAPGGGERIVLALVPGRAFGTGEHPTTRLCVEALERRVSPGSRWLDLGCGSGILSVVAARSGAAEVLALDVDPEAAAVAREVAVRNGVERVVHVAAGTRRAAARATWDGIACNISCGILTRAARPLAALLRPGGTLVASGWLEGDRPEVEAALAGRAGLGVLEVRALDGWGVWIGERAPGRA